MFNKSIEYCTVLGSSDDQNDIDFAQFDHRSVILNEVVSFSHFVHQHIVISVLVIVSSVYE